jgi:hypothetical protein
LKIFKIIVEVKNGSITSLFFRQGVTLLKALLNYFNANLAMAFLALNIISNMLTKDK